MVLDVPAQPSAGPAPNASNMASVTATTSSTRAPTPPIDCSGSDRRLYGSTCCEVLGKREEKFPGMVFLRCEGPQLGAPCASKSDCDVVCSCDSAEAPRSPGKGMQGPKDGTRGVKGTCGGTLAVGVWMCEIDEHGVVTHVIVD
jgi:hypothetical protein